MPIKLNTTVISLLALIVSALSATFSFVQYRTATAQLRLNEQQLRPYVKYIPIFQPIKGSLAIDMVLENYSPIPARVLHTELTGWVNGDHVGFDFHSLSPDLLYQHKGGRSSVPPIRDALYKSIQTQKSLLSIGVCVVYATAAKTGDSRVWLHKAVYEYLPDSDLPVTRYIDEEEVSSGVTKCTAKDVESHVRREQPSVSTPASGKRGSTQPPNGQSK